MGMEVEVDNGETLNQPVRTLKGVSRLCGKDGAHMHKKWSSGPSEPDLCTPRSLHQPEDTAGYSEVQT